MQTNVLIWLVAGVALGVFVTMIAFALMVAVDRRAFRRKLRRAGASKPGAPTNKPPAPAVAASQTAANSKPASAVASPVAAASKRPPARPAPIKDTAVSPTPKTRNDVPAATAPGPPVAAAPGEETPALSVEEMFAKAFEAAVPTVPKAKPEGEEAAKS